VAADDARLPKRLAWITGLRLLFLSLLLAATAFFYLRGELADHPQSQLIVFASIGSAFALAAAYATVLRSGKHLRRLAGVQILLDQLTWTAIVYVSGGATSGATSFYGLTVLVGAILIGLRGAAIAAITGVTCFGLLSASLALGVLHPPADQAAMRYVVTWDHIAYPLLVNGLGIVVVALLAGYLADRLRHTGGALARAEERATAAERLAMLGRLATGLAHEIRNPLGSISASVQLLREAPGLSTEDKRLCEIIQAEASRLNNLVSDMMDVARPKKPEPADVDVAALAREVVALASKSERGGAGDVAVRYEGPEEPVRARCDAAQMRQVLWNLVRNGVQASAAGSTVTVTVAPHGDRVRMLVTDEGPGIPPEGIPRIFDAFYTTRSHGAGIGLAVVRRIIDDHADVGATIDVHSTANGATFEVGLARAPTPATREPATAPLKAERLRAL
jgi:signal transduction histidine kinase